MSDAAQATAHDDPWRQRCPRGHTTWEPAPHAHGHDYRCGQCRDLCGVDHKSQRLYDAKQWEFPVPFSARPPVEAEFEPACHTRSIGATDWQRRIIGRNNIPDRAEACQRCFTDYRGADEGDEVVIDAEHNRECAMRYHKIEVIRRGDPGVRGDRGQFHATRFTALVGALWLLLLFAMYAWAVMVL